MECQGFRNLLPGWLAGDLSDHTRREAKEHLARCPACRESVREHRQIERSIEEMGMAAVPASLVSKVLRGIERLSTHDPCARTRAHLEAHLEGSLTETERAAFDGHLGECAACRGLVERVLAKIRWVERSLERLPSVDPPEGLLPSILRRLEESPAARGARLRLPAFLAGALAVLAAAFGLRPSAAPLEQAVTAFDSHLIFLALAALAYAIGGFIVPDSLLVLRERALTKDRLAEKS